MNHKSAICGTVICFVIFAAGPVARAQDDPLKIEVNRYGSPVSVMTVIAGGFGEQLGLKVGDVIDNVNGTAINSYEELHKQIRAGTVRLHGTRKGKSWEAEFKYVTVVATNPDAPPAVPRPEIVKSVQLGHHDGDASEQVSDPLQIRVNRYGSPVSVMVVTPGGFGEHLGLKVGDVINTVNGKDINSWEDLHNGVRADQVQLHWTRNGESWEGEFKYVMKDVVAPDAPPPVRTPDIVSAAKRQSESDNR